MTRRDRTKPVSHASAIHACKPACLVSKSDLLPVEKTTSAAAANTTSSCPVPIPGRDRREPAQFSKHYASTRRKRQTRQHPSDALPPSLATLLALTDVPRRKPKRIEREPTTLVEIASEHQVCEKDSLFSRSRGPLDLLLSPSGHDIRETIASRRDHPIPLLARSSSADSVPSLVDSLATDAESSSLDDPVSADSSLLLPRRRCLSPARKPLEPLHPAPDATEGHPLATARFEVAESERHSSHRSVKNTEVTEQDDGEENWAVEEEEEEAAAPGMQSRLGQGVEEDGNKVREREGEASQNASALASVGSPERELPLEPGPSSELSHHPSLSPKLPGDAFKPLRSVFRSNLTASLRALRSAARSFSSFNFTSIPPEDFLTRSILTIDPKAPYADEPRPPLSEEIPSAELRRYLNPATTSHLESLRSSRLYSASIQMQTYRIQRSRSPLAARRGPRPPSLTYAMASAHPHPHSHASQLDRPGCPTPLSRMRQREMRENPDFIRIAVMEMAMRRRGKLDSQQPGRARWALPPRRQTRKPYETIDGVPARWVPLES